MEKHGCFGYGLAFAIALVIVAALASTVHADTGVYNYNITIPNVALNQSIGSDMSIKAFVAYNGLPVREYPCLLTFYDLNDYNTTMISERVYTDELGQILYVAKVGDNFENGYNYTYDVQCSNRTAFGKLFITTNSRHTFIQNLLVWFRQPDNRTFLIAAGAVALIAFVIAMILLSAAKKAR